MAKIVVVTWECDKLFIGFYSKKRHPFIRWRNTYLGLNKKLKTLKRVINTHTNAIRSRHCRNTFMPNISINIGAWR